LRDCLKSICAEIDHCHRTIGIEDLKHIRSRVTVRRSQRDRHSKWAFAQLREFLTYKAKREGVTLKVVESKNTSRQCPKYQHIEYQYYLSLTFIQNSMPYDIRV
jgi:putative transposase